MRKKYVCPKCRYINLEVESLLNTASPGITNEGFNPWSRSSESSEGEFDEDGWN